MTKALFNPEGTRTVMRVMKRLDPAAAERAKRRLQAAEDLDAWRINNEARNACVRRAIEAGLDETEISERSGIARSTIKRILAGQ